MTHERSLARIALMKFVRYVNIKRNFTSSIQAHAKQAHVLATGSLLSLRGPVD